MINIEWIAIGAIFFVNVQQEGVNSGCHTYRNQLSDDNNLLWILWF